MDKSLNRESTDSHRLKEVKKNKPCKNGKFRVWIMCIVLIFEFFDCEGAKYRETYHCTDC